MSWYDSIFDTVGNWFSGDSKVGTSLISGALGLYGAYNQNKMIDAQINALKSQTEDTGYGDYQNYLDVLAQWQAANPSNGSGSGSGRSYPYASYAKAAIDDLAPYSSMALKQTKKQIKAYNEALKDLKNLKFDEELSAPSYSRSLGMEEAKKKNGN